ncbi:unnamed protein product [Callosobruchus maculatus]|uniref:DUF7869 domain-containing protein n=1 Tax=Callosobruchus maculatus TaxID=64391 RepID=A0A653BEM4_CALMS|nr:unnamed protein product [Callosobruchus maculatus]
MSSRIARMFELLPKTVANTERSENVNARITGDMDTNSDRKSFTTRENLETSADEVQNQETYYSPHAGTSGCTNKPLSPNLDTNICAKNVANLDKHVTGDTSEENDVASNFGDYDSDDSVVDPDYGEEDVKEEENIEDEDGSKQRSRKRRSVPEKWKKNERKKKRHSGLEHRTQKEKKLVKRKIVKPPCSITCKLKCWEKISEEERKKIHRQYWTDQKSIDMKRQFIASHVQQIPVVRRRERNYERELRRKHTNRYSSEQDRKQATLCKKFFLITLSISQQTVDTAIEKKRDGGLLSPDKRGKHIPSNKVPAEVRNLIREHISLFPAYESHYTRERSTKKYLGNHLNVSRMFKLYLEYCHEKLIPEELIGKEWLYSDVFNYEFNLAFKNPDLDTCDECDKYKIKMQEAGSQDIRSSFQEEYEKHLEDAGDRYKMKAADKQSSKENLSKTVVMIDLQKCLPTPDLHNSQSFYSLKLWTYDLVIHNSTDEKSYCMMWDESIAGRGGNEVASCLLKWSEICDIPNNVTELIIWSDNCPSQNRNAQIMMCYFIVLNRNTNLKKITHKFLTKGHTHLEADGDHSVIEREKKKVPQLRIVTPWDWQQVVRLCGVKKSFIVTAMETEDFLNFKSLCEGPKSPLVLRKKDDSGDNFLVSQCVCLQVRRDSPGTLFYKTNFRDEFLAITLTRNTRNKAYLPETLPLKSVKNLEEYTQRNINIFRSYCLGYPKSSMASIRTWHMAKRNPIRI